MIPASSSSGFVLDLASLEGMKARARTSPEQSEAEVARQFEALFVQMMLRSMRDASFKTGLLDNHQTRMMQSLQDEQTALHMSEQRGLGLAEVLTSQMQRIRSARETAIQLAQDPGQATGLPAQAASLGSPEAGAAARRANAGVGEAAGFPAFAPAAQPHRLYGNQASAGGLPVQSGAVTAHGKSDRGGIAGVLDSIRSGAVAAAQHGAELGRRAVADVPAHVEVFVRRLEASAERVANVSGLPKRLILAQAALESGWGRQEIRHADGTPSHNLFGIKATGGWRGGVAEVMTTEYVDGAAQRMREPFRAYGSYDEALHDYARLLTDNPRYQAVLEAPSDVEAARRVQEAGYATDPRYADKLIAIMRQLPV